MLVKRQRILIILAWLSLLIILCSFIVWQLDTAKIVLAPLNPSPNDQLDFPSKSEPAFQPNSPDFSTIFADDHSWTATLSADLTTTVLVTGDVLLAREVNYQSINRQDWHWPFLKTADVLRQADITVVNLETPLIANCPPMRDRMVFCGDPNHAATLGWAGVDVASLANNHALNQGPAGVTETVELLDSAGVQTTGLLGKPTVIERNGITFTFLGYTDLGATQNMINPADMAQLKMDIAQAKQNSDVVIPFFHWGEEYTYHPTARQRELAQAAVTAGADLVIGNHAHWYQELEFFEDTLIMYSHGNFVFDQMWSTETRQGLAGRYTFYENKLIDAEFLPVLIEDYGQPYFLTGDAKQERLKHLEQISQIGDQLTDD